MDRVETVFAMPVAKTQRQAPALCADAWRDHLNSLSQ